MTVDVQTIAPCRQKLIITVPAEETRAPYDDIIAMFIRHGNPPGFRAGKAPRAVIERHYRADIDKEVRQSLIGKFYRRALEQEKITAVDIVDVGSVLFTPATGATFTITIDVAPEFKLPQYKGIPVKVEEKPVAEQEVDDQITRMRKMLATHTDVKDAPAQFEDAATVDYEAALNGKPLAETVPNLPVLTGVKGHVITLGESAPLPKEFDALVGAKPGETVSFEATFPKDFPIPELQDATVNYTATLVSLRRPEPLDDATLLEKIQFAKGMDALRQNIREELEHRNTARQRNAKFDIIAQHLVSRCKFDLPKIETAQEVNRTAQSMMTNIIQSGATREQIEEHRDTLLQNASDTAERRLRVRYILSRIADEEKITATDQEVDQRLRQIAYENRQPFEKAKAEIEKNYGLEAVRQEVRIHKAIDILVDAAETK